MNQRALLQSLDASISAAFASAGMADAALYLPEATVPPAVPAPVAAACTVLVDRDIEIYGQEQPDVATRHVVVTLFRGEVEPAQYGTVTLVDTLTGLAGEAFRLEAKLDEDESKSRWVVSHV